MSSTFQPGSLVKLRNRDWIVLPSNDPEILMVKPLGGSDSETTGIYLPFAIKDEMPTTTVFPSPSENNIGNFSTANLLYNAARLSFRDVAGPFRCIGKLSFRPRAYQIVPLVMALRLDPIRLLIADDVGIGKTVEALMIVKELLDRGEIKRFSVITPPHLCDQWQQELKDKFSIDAVIVRSSTAAKLDRKTQGDDSIFKAFPFQVISIDFIKSDKRRSTFLSECPELVIVDEVHTCTKPAGASVSQQQRYHLINSIAKKENQHLIMLTATPHSGKQPEFQSLLGLLKPEYETVDIVNSSSEKRKEVASKVVIRRRTDIDKWFEDTPFPQREQKEIEYELSPEYKSIFHDLLSFVRELGTSIDEMDSRKKFRYFAILSLLRGVMSSPDTGIEMLSRKAEQVNISDDEIVNEIINPVADGDETDSDATPINLFDKIDLRSNEANILKNIAVRLSTAKDNKAYEAAVITTKWVKEGYNPILFCRFISTAEYLGKYLRDKLPHKTEILIITGNIVDEERREKIKEFGKSPNPKVLVTTDCLSEGINLQEHFTAVLHYDLPWNPNRLEQREGRIDRYGQSAPDVKAYMLWGKDNPIDSVVLNVLLRKAREIKKQTGISVPFPDNSQSILDSLLNSILLNRNAVTVDDQISLDLDLPEIEEKELSVTDIYDRAAENNKATRSVFAQHSIKVEEIEQDLKSVDIAIGGPDAVRDFVVATALHLGGQISKYKSGYRLYTTNLPPIFKQIFDYKDEVHLSFYSPTPEGYGYIGRNHQFVEQLSRFILNSSIYSNDAFSAARVSVVPTNKVNEKTTIIQLRIRNIILDERKKNELIAEEMILWGYMGSLEDKKFIDEMTAKDLLENTVPTSDWAKQRQTSTFNHEMEKLDSAKDIFADVVHKRSEKLIEAHERFRKVIGGGRYKIVEPVLPPDLLGVYILMPSN